LDALYERVASWRGVVVKFAPALSGKGKLVAEETEKWAKIIRAANIRVE